MNSNSNQKRIAFGYNRNPVNRIVLHPGQAAAVKMIYQSYVDGTSGKQTRNQGELAQYLVHDNNPAIVTICER